VRATDLRHGPAAARRACSALNDTQAGRAHAGVQDRRRQRPAAAGPEGPARHAAARGRQRQGSSPPSTATSSPPVDRRHPARPAGDRGSRAATSSSASRCSTSTTSCRPTQGARRDQHPGRRQADELAAAVCDLPAVDAVASCSSTCPRWATSTSPSWCSSSTRRTCCSTTRPRRCSSSIEQVVRLIRSKGVGVVLRHPEPAGHPRHRAGPARQPRAARAARLHAARPEGGEGGRTDHARRTRRWTCRTAITELAVGEALVSPARREGPLQHDRARLRAAAGAARIGPLTPSRAPAADRQGSLVAGVYEQAVDRESAYEKLRGPQRQPATGGRGSSSGRNRRATAPQRRRRPAAGGWA